MTSHIVAGNYAFGVLTSPITNVSTSITFTTSTGASFPTLSATSTRPQQYFYLTLVDAATQGIVTREIVKVVGPSAATTGSITYTIIRAQEGTTASAFAAGDGVQLRWTQQTAVDYAAQGTPIGWFYVGDFGAVGDGTTDDTAAIQAAITAANASNGGIVYFKAAQYKIASGLTLTNNVSLQGCGGTGFLGTWDASLGQTPRQTVFLVTSLSDPCIHITGANTGISHIVFFYPNQVLPTAPTPTTYPPTIHYESTDLVIRQCSFLNAFYAMKFEGGRYNVADCWIGAFYRGMTIDRSGDISVLHNVFFEPLWDTVTGSPYPSLIDTWVAANGISMTVSRQDAFQFSNINMFASGHVGMFFNDSVYGSSYGQISNLMIDAYEFAIEVSSTTPGGDLQGISICNLKILSGTTGIWLRAGGANVPYLQVTRGTFRGTFSGGAYLVDAGQLLLDQVYGADLPGGPITTPAVPASSVAATNTLPFPVAVYISGGTYTDVVLGGYSLGSAQQTVTVKPYQTIAIVYSSAPTWSWFTA